MSLGPIHHLAYVVDEIEPAARRLNEQFGAGPFFYLEEVPVRDVSSRGEPGEFVHASAFGLCNGLPTELMKIERLAPARAAEGFAGDATPRFHHIAYAVPPASLPAVREQLESAGLPEYLKAHFGEDVEFTYHDARASLGHDLEIHADSEGLRGFFAMFAEATASWDGASDLMRPALG